MASWPGPELLVGLVLAFVVGFAIQRGSVCVVAAARQLVNHGRAHRIKAFLLVACWSAVAILPLAWLFPNHVSLSPGYPVGLRTVLAASVYAVGAWLNSACAFGTLSALTRGQLRFLVTVAGMTAGAILSVPLQPARPELSILHESVLAEATWMSIAAWTAALVLVVRATHRWLRGRRNRNLVGNELLHPAHWRPSVAMAMLGIFGGVLYAGHEKWTYLSLLSDRTSALVRADEAVIGLGALLASAALLTGGVVAAIFGGRFEWQRVHRGALVRQFVGGGMMSGAAAILPGGNDALLLYGLPSAVPHAIVAYTVMILSLYGVMQSLRWLRSRPPGRSAHAPPT